MLFADSAFERPQCIGSKFWYVMWLRIFYVRILHDFCKECTCQHFWALNCCFWLYFAFYVTHEWFEVLLIIQKILRHTIRTSKAYFDIALVALYTYTDLHTHLPVQIYSYCTYTFTNTTYSPLHMDILICTYIYTDIQTFTYLHIYMYLLHTRTLLCIHTHLHTKILLLIIVLPVLLPTTIADCRYLLPPLL